MDIQLRYRLWRMRRSARPGAAFRRTLEAELRRKSGNTWHWIPVGNMASGLVTLGLLAGSGTSVYAYTSEEVLPGSALYPVREGIERMELASSFSATRREAVKQKHQARHKLELERLRARRAGSSD